jgi:hypothetical protein
VPLGLYGERKIDVLPLDRPVDSNYEPRVDPSRDGELIRVVVDGALPFAATVTTCQRKLRRIEAAVALLGLDDISSADARRSVRGARRSRISVGNPVVARALNRLVAAKVDAFNALDDLARPTAGI